MEHLHVDSESWINTANCQVGFELITCIPSSYSMLRPPLDNDFTHTRTCITPKSNELRDFGTEWIGEQSIKHPVLQYSVGNEARN